MANTITALKSKKPNAERLQAIADYFNVSTDCRWSLDNPAIADKNNSFEGKEVNVEELASNLCILTRKPQLEKVKKHSEAHYQEAI